MKTLRQPLLLLAVGCLFLLSACTSSRSAQMDAAPEAPAMSMEQELVAQSIAARGGLETIQAVESVRWTATVEMMGMNMPLTVYQKRPGKLRTEVEIPSMDMEVVSGYDGETAWTVNPMAGGVQKITGPQAERTREMADIDGVLVNYEEKGYTVEYLGEEDVRGMMAHKLKVVRADLPEAFVYLDAETFLQVKSEGEGMNPQTGTAAQMTTYQTDYRNVDGMMMPFGIEVVMDGQLFQKITLNNATTNVELDDELFVIPEQ